MKIAVNARFLLQGPLEGLGWYTHEIVQRLAVQHPEDEFILLFDRPYDARFLFADNVRPVVLFPPARHPLLWYMWFEWAVPRALRRLRPDVFFSPDSYLSLATRTPTVMTVHDLIPLETPEKVPHLARWFYQHFWPRYFRRAERLVVISDFTRQRLLQLTDADPTRVSVIPNGCRAGFAPLSAAAVQAMRQEVSGGEPYFFFSGAIHPRKNVARLIRAFDAFKSKTGASTKLLLAGRQAWDTAEVTAAYEHSRHRADMLFLGYLDEKRLPEVLGAALALAYVSESEGFGLPILEAFHAEVPVLTSTTTAMPEVAGNAAVLVNPFSVEEIAVGLERLWADAGLREELIARGRTRREAFSWDAAAAKIYAALVAVAGR